MPDEQQIEAQQQEENRDERPDWLPDNFKSPEDLASSYKELQGEFTRTRQQMKEQQEAWEDFLVQQQQAQEQAQFQQQLPSIQEQLYADYEQDPVATTGRLVQAAVAQAFQQYAQPDPRSVEAQSQVYGELATQKLQAQYSDWNDYKDKISDEIRANPELYPESLFTTPQGIQKALDRAYKAAKLDTLASSTEETIEEQIARQRAAKLQAQTLSGAAGRPPAQDQWEQRWEQIQSAPSRSYRDLF